MEKYFINTKTGEVRLAKDWPAGATDLVEVLDEWFAPNNNPITSADPIDLISIL